MYVVACGEYETEMPSALCLYVGHRCISLSQNPMDIRDAHGVQINKLPGSRVEYSPFPGGFKIIPE